MSDSSTALPVEQEPTAAAHATAPHGEKRALEVSEDATAAASASEVESASKKMKAESAFDDETLVEKDVGIEEYVSSSLAPVIGIIKQRFSDFQVREIAPDGRVCIVTDLGPPAPSYAGAPDIKKELQTQIEERDDATGSLRQQRLEEERAQREAARVQREKDSVVKEKYDWSEEDEDVDLSKEEELMKLLGSRVRDELKDLWEQGPNAFTKPAPEEAAPAAETPQEAECEATPSSRGGRGRGRGRGGRGGRDGGRGGGRGGAAAGGRSRNGRDNGDPRRVITDALASKEMRGQVHQIIREMFKGRFITDTVENNSGAAPPKASAEDDDDEDALANKAAAAASSSNGAPVNAIGIRWNPHPSGKDARLLGRGHHSRDIGEVALPPYIYFYLQKTNRDTQDALNLLARALGLGGGNSALANLNKIVSREMTIAGTKDKRGVTVQRVSLRRGKRTAEDVWKAINGVGRELFASSDRGGRGGRGGRGRGGRGGRGGAGSHGPRKTALDAVSTRGDRGIRVAHVEYKDKPLYLGDLSGNRFEIVLRNLKVDSEETAYKAIEVLKTKGFINYYGMQRFGITSLSSHHVGLPLIRSDYATAVSLLLTARKDDTPEMKLAKELYSQGKIKDAYLLVPRGATAERAILSKMLEEEKKHGEGVKHNDFAGYFGAIPKTLRTMYTHAYQSYLWNRLASERVRRFGVDGPVEGDVVFADAGEFAEAADADADADADVDVDAGADADADVDAADGQGEDQVEGDVDGAGGAEAEASSSRPDTPSNGTTSVPASKGRYAAPPKVKCLTAAEVSSGAYTIHDVLIPSCGSEVRTPEGWMRSTTDAILAADGLTVEDLALARGKNNDMLLRGTYRKLLGRPRDVQAGFMTYTRPDEPLCQSDEDALLGLDPVPRTYATIAEARAAGEASARAEAEAQAQAAVEVDEQQAKQEEESPATTTTTTTAAADAPSPPALFLALKLSFSLSTASYATMALRELTKVDTSSANQKSLTERGEDQGARRGEQREQHVNYLGVHVRRGEKVNEVEPRGGRRRAWGAGAGAGAGAAMERETGSAGAGASAEAEAGAKAEGEEEMQTGA